MGKLGELQPGSSIEKRIMARRIAVFNVGGSLYGIESDCKHMKASLTTGEIAGGVLTCSWHGWKYDLETGECLGRPGMRLRRYEVIIEQGNIYVII
jgi:nitrite reductase/ring-hydroxylating ferredoxin subunit